ncbi:4-oxalocrotonate tautomerase [Bradyrhizobium sp. INPA01-394B]|uniref:Tautomerase family protein n=1 Tax=Bradyrhizobium campsiandrae TaxID=1729892 RepID=A0ABR7U4Z8_9BRAD|nr:tautomerase family protein [Bradyrhizobium campsiandrae]MBC9879906.1 4-oxalocrotonate tautomerase [Bradyrhizobium campsiandrae]MBC9978591.1 tautomerase family protein [Bradyrhizobium campsiandrae]
MPTYIVTCTEGRLSGPQKSRIAEAVTRAHGETTGAPFYFAQVTFNEVRSGNYFLGGAPLDGDHIFVHGTIRDGRPTELKDKLLVRLTSDIAFASEMKPSSVWVYISELPPNQMVEFGRVLPLHGKEAEWSAALPEAEKARLEAIGIPRGKAS